MRVSVYFSNRIYTKYVGEYFVEMPLLFIGNQNSLEQSLTIFYILHSEDDFGGQGKRNIILFHRTTESHVRFGRDRRGHLDYSLHFKRCRKVKISNEN